MTTSSDTIRLALLDDHPIIRRSLEIVADSAEDITVVGSFGHSHELYRWLSHNDCDVLILDYFLHSDELDGLSLIKQLLARYPRLKILLSSSMESLAVIRTAFMLGIMGYIAKREEAEIYLQAIRTLFHGQRYFPANIAIELSQIPVRKRDERIVTGANASEMISPGRLLTPREAEVLQCYLSGMSIVEIAAKLKRSRKTVSGHKQTGMKKLGITNNLELFKYRHDLLPNGNDGIEE